MDCRKTRILGRNFFMLRRLYLTAFPKIERHPVTELFSASSRGKAEFLQFTDAGEFIGLAYMIVRGSVAFLLYLAVDDSKRNRGYGSARPACGGEANYDILNTNGTFRLDAYRFMLERYPFKSYLEEIRKAQ